MPSGLVDSSADVACLGRVRYTGRVRSEHHRCRVAPVHVSEKTAGSVRASCSLGRAIGSGMNGVGGSMPPSSSRLFIVAITIHRSHRPICTVAPFASQSRVAMLLALVERGVCVASSPSAVREPLKIKVRTSSGGSSSRDSGYGGDRTQS